MNILHLTDLHFSDRGKDPTKIIRSIITKIKEESISIDFVFFTGDIVNAGSDNAQYSQAVELLFSSLQSELQIDACNIIIEKILSEKGEN